MIDLRSDTVTRPTPAMREAMASAEVGDDVYSEDPTVNRLEREAAEVFGREASIFVPTGTMGNQIAIRLHTQHGQEVICEARSHVLDWEMAMMAAFSGCLARTVAAERGILTWDHIKPAIKIEISHRSAPSEAAFIQQTAPCRFIMKFGDERILPVRIGLPKQTALSLQGNVNIGDVDIELAAVV